RFELPVCNRWPDERRVVRVRAHTFLEPFIDDETGTDYPHIKNHFDYADLNNNSRHDPGEPSEQYLDLSQGARQDYIRGESGKAEGRGPVASCEKIAEELWRANVSYSALCIRVELAGPILVEHAPLDPTGADILADGFVTAPEEDPTNSDALMLYRAYAQ